MTTRRRLTFTGTQRLMDAVNAVPTMQDPQHRQRVVDELVKDVGDQFDPVRFQDSSLDNWSIARACVTHHAVPYLITVLRIMGGVCEELNELDSVASELLADPAPEPATKDEIEHQVKLLLSALSADSMASVMSHRRLAEEKILVSGDVSDPVKFYEQLTEFTVGGEERLLMLFLELAAHQLEDHFLVEMHSLAADLVGDSDDIAAVRELCQKLQQDSPVKGAAKSESNPSGGESTPKDDPLNTPLVEPRLASLTPPALWGGVPPRNSNFTGREDLLNQIHESLDHHMQSALVPQPLHGLGGVGKSQLAVEFAYRFQFDYQLVWWIPADEDRLIRRSLVSLARRLGLPESEDVGDTVDTVLDALRRGDPYSRWLLIYDNAPEPGVVHRYLPYGPGQVLITSRSRTWAMEANSIEIDVFKSHESIELLQARWTELTDEDALRLADRLGHLPLALEQAVAVHAQTGMPLTDYLRALNDSPVAILDEGTPVSHQTSVAETFGLAYRELKERSPAAAQLLELCAFLSSQPIAIPLLTAGRGAQLPADLQSLLRDDIPLRRAIRELGRFALAQLDSHRDFIKLHSLVRAVLRDSIKPEQRSVIEHNAHAILAFANPGRPDSPDSWTRHAQIAPHVVPSGLIHSADPDVCYVVLDQIRYHYAIGDYAVSRELGQQAVETWRARLGADAELTLVASRHLANSLRALGESQQARLYNEDTLARMVRTLGEEHEHSLATANSVAADLRLLGHFQQALERDEENLVRHQRVLGDDDPGTLRVLNNLALDFLLLGDFRRAHELDEANVARRANVYGEEHHQTLFSHNHVARDLYSLGEYRRGLDLMQEKLPVYEKKLRSGHQNLLEAKRTYAILLRKAGHVAPALEEAQHVYDAHRRKFGRLHEHTLSALVTLSNSCRAFGDLDAALGHGQGALRSYREVFTGQHPFTLACKANVAIVLRLLERVDDAMELNDDALAGFVNALGADHPYTLCCANNRANGLAAAGHTDEARLLSQQTLERSRQVCGENHPNTLACAANFALDLDTAGEAVKANALRKETLKRFLLQLGREHPETINVGLQRRVDCDIEVPAS